ncbi:serine threonine protein kinase [Diplodia corticola]|uniref:Serine threonine protein kinase n=1 Tax=Diplodia corticola TaxID=236234 RepID=A0A1J9SAG0_9PEZI|nr:serine threonine protein kinase [Diplodia corticola]OJD36868.1 serine threonine protein kinase [Diplodia corticola]
MTEPKCVQAHNSLWNLMIEPQINEKYSPGGPRGPGYVPIKSIHDLWVTAPLREIYLCTCSTCASHGGPVDNRALLADDHMGKINQEYASVYALLLSLSVPTLINEFIANDARLGDAYFSESSLAFLSKLKLSPDHIASVRKRILFHQYQFHVRKIGNSPIAIFSNKEFVPIEEDTEHLGEGNFGEVFGFKIQSDDYVGETIKRSKATRLVRKVFKNSISGPEEWLKILQIRKINHPHLMTAICAFHHGSVFSIVFERAEDTLEEFLKSKESAFEHSKLWEQVKGIAEGLSYLHGRHKNNGAQEKIAYHLDLKPANILILKARDTQGYIMKISDFGLSRFKPPPMGSGSSNLDSDNHHRAPGYYAPPPNEPYSPAWDIWSLGAIILEIATFDIHDKGELSLFRKERRWEDPNSMGTHAGTEHFYKSEPDGPTLKGHVLSRIESLQERFQKSRDENRVEPDQLWQKNFFQRDFFNLIRQMLRIEPKERPSTDEVVEQLNNLHQSASQMLLNRGYSSALPDIWEMSESDLGAAFSGEPCTRIDCFYSGGARRQKCSLFIPNSPLQNLVRLGIWSTDFSNGSGVVLGREFSVTTHEEYGLQPLYAPSILTEPSEKWNVGLKLLPSRDAYNFEFRERIDVLRFQELLLRQFIYPK